MCPSAPSENEGETRKDDTSIDFSRIDFPSDRLTIKHLRLAYPQLFDHGLESQGKLQPIFFSVESGPPAENFVGEMLFSERLVAAFAYCAASGIPEPKGWEGQEGLQGFKDDLVEFYCKLGMATGANHAQELVRDIERQASRMAPDIPR